MGILFRRVWPVLLLALGLGCATRWPFAATTVNLAPPTSQAGPLNLDEYKGKVVLLSFWHSSCPPCRAMFPHEKHLVEQFRGASFVLLGVNADPDSDRMRKTIEKSALTWRSHWDGADGAVGAKYKVDRFPTLVLLDAMGQERWRHVGAPPPGVVEAAISGLLPVKRQDRREARRLAGPLAAH